MSITTFTDLIKTPNSEKIYLVEITPTVQLITWESYSGDVYYADIEAVEVLSLYEDGSIMTEVDSLASIAAGKWYHGKNKIYVQASADEPYDKVIVATLKKYFATKTKRFDNDLYEGIVLSVPVISQKKNELYYGVSVITGGQLSLANNSEELDSIYKKYSWNNQSISILLGGEDLPYSEYAKIFTGIIIKKHYSTGMMDIQYQDTKKWLEEEIPLNSFSSSDYANLDPEDEGRPIPLCYGTVYKVPVVCTTKALGTSTSLHSFKICDTSVCSVTVIDKVYVNDKETAFLSGSVSTAAFKLATSTFTPGDEVTASVVSDLDNPVEQIKYIASNVLSIPYNSTYYNTSTVSLAVINAEDYECGTFIGERKSFLDIIGELMQSCLGSFTNDNNGLFTIRIWDTSIDENMTSVDYNEIKEDSFSAESRIDTIKKVVRVGWKKSWLQDTYSYKQVTSDKTEKIYGITKSKTVPTNLSTEASAEILADRLKLMFETETNNLSFEMKMQLADKNIGDRVSVSFKRRAEDNYVDWIDSMIVEINSITKDLLNSIIKVTADDLKGMGANVGRWTDNPPVFPSQVGGGNASPWDSSWTASQKAYAKSHFGYWTDDNGFADPSDPDAYLISRWW